MKTINAPVTEQLVRMPAGDVELQGYLSMPVGMKGMVIFAHGSGSSRFSPRNRTVSHHLIQRNFGTLLFDLMTDREGEMERWNMENRFNIPFLSRRLEAVTDWLIRKFEAEHVYAPIGYFGASTGSAAAIEASARHPGQIAAIVSRGGRPDLAVWSLRHIEAPTLLIVGSEDPDVLRWNEEAYEYIRAVRKLHIIKGATHLFEEPGALQHVARAAGDWFDRYLRMPRHAGG